jgi:hypothetical protein
LEMMFTPEDSMPREFILTTNDVLVVSHTLSRFDESEFQTSEFLSRRDYLSIERLCVMGP